MFPGSDLHNILGIVVSTAVVLLLLGTADDDDDGADKGEAEVLVEEEGCDVEDDDDVEVLLRICSRSAAAGDCEVLGASKIVSTWVSAIFLALIAF